MDVVHRGVGAITESDILLAKASGAIVLGFHVRPDSNARAAAEREQVDVRTYRIIYEAVEDVRNALEGLLKPEERETVLGEAEVLQLFKVSKVGTIAGCSVRTGTIQRTAKARVIRDGATVYTGALSSLKRFKDDVREVREGLECGIGIENFNDLKVGDRIESFRMEEIKRTLCQRGGRRGASASVGDARDRRIQTWDLHLPGCHSLKEKRGAQAAHRRRSARSSTSPWPRPAHQDLWQRAEIACAAVGIGAVGGRRNAAGRDRAVEEADGVRIVDTVTVFR